MNTHMDKQMFKCICGKEFSQKGNLTTHYKKHFIKKQNFSGDDIKTSPVSTFNNDVNKHVSIDNVNIINSSVNLNCDFEHILSMDSNNSFSSEFPSNVG